MDFINKMFGKEPPSKDIAKERLKLILIHDRSDMSPQFLESIKNDIIKVISDYAEVDRDGIEVKYEDEMGSPALVASIPLKNTKKTSRR